MRSMTGFGRASAEKGGTRVVAEIRGLNQRFFELKTNLPRGWGEHEAHLRKSIQEVVSRGRVELFVRQMTIKAPKARLEVNEPLAKLYVRELGRLAGSLKLKGQIGVEMILHRPEIFHVIEEETDEAHGVKMGFDALAKALKHFDAERVREGTSLKRDFAARIKKIRSILPAIEKLSKQTRDEVLNAFRARIQELIGEVPVNERRLFEEAASAAQRGDITEELTRLRIHLDGLAELIERDGPIGKSIEFLLQEINREVNTMGSKSQNAALSHLTVELKGETEKMREQVQNVE